MLRIEYSRWRGRWIVIEDRGDDNPVVRAQARYRVLAWLDWISLALRGKAVLD